jgi:hypothetical protein
MQLRKIAGMLPLIWAVSLDTGTVLWAASPANDNFRNRIILTGTNITATGSNINATKEPGEPNHAGNTGGRSVWWSWTAPSNGDLTITTDGSTNTDGSFLDTLLAVYTGTTVSSLSVVASNDDHGVLVTSRVRFQAIQGTSYQIAVDGFNDGTTIDSGYIMLNLIFISEPIVRPPNDNFTNGIVLNGTTVVTNGNNVLATREPGEPVHAGKFGDTSVWWTWTAPSATNVTVSTYGSSFDTLLAIYIGAALTNLTLVAYDDDIDPEDGFLSSTATFDATAGQTYQIAVDGFDGASGQIVLRISPSQRAFLSAPKRLSDGTFQFLLNGQIGQAYEINSSSNLTSWTAIATLVSTNPSIIFIDSSATNSVRQFYRAVQMP